MDERDLGQCRDDNADALTPPARVGDDVCRDALNAAVFFDMLPDVSGRRGLDIGCGEGHHPRLLAQRGADVTACDYTARSLAHALATERAEPHGIRYLIASVLQLPFADVSFDFVTGFMSLMDMPQQDRVLAEVFRVLKPGGFLQFSITHPCYDTKIRRKVRNGEGRHYGYEIGGYWDTTPWAPEWNLADPCDEDNERSPHSPTPRFRRTISEWINALVRTGFAIEEAGEPYPSAAVLTERPDLSDITMVPHCLHLRCRKP